ncbi:MAG: UDP-3-O-acyl-N-acetylglucosamine deacetylase [Rickettsiales bacterium]|jgi:UDP-3-O-[3-hydroxymyristoyl] N-acetylglucosamine deacetylase|nr:UDP-3-O-acyl-N-acetylglucosamine deacetylase [Rickettsiales bacterium]
MKKSVKFSGIGLMSGKKVNVKVVSRAQSGIFFHRTDIPNAAPIQATFDNFINSGQTNTTIGKFPNCVQTIEHFMAALFILGINSVDVYLDNSEFPIMDGAAEKFINLLSVFPYKKHKKIIIKREIIATRREIIKQMPIFQRIALFFYGLKTGRREDGWVKLSPGGRVMNLDIIMDYPDKIIGRQHAQFLFNDSVVARKKFISEFAPARTFGRIWELEYLKKHGMGLGASLDNVLAINEKGDGVLNGLKYPDEFVRHKLLDAIGDFYTSGGMVIGKIESFKGSHSLNNLALKKLFANSKNYTIK